MATDIIARGMAGSALNKIDGITVGGAPYIQGGNWYVWNGNSYVDSGIKAEGANGVGITDITLTNTEGLVDTYTIKFTDGKLTTYTVTNGKNGENGIDGKNGENGIDGLSAYQIAIEEGFSGTKEEWLSSLKGTPGEKGNNATINGKESIIITAGENITISDTIDGIEISSNGGSGGTSNYNDLTNKPLLNGITIEGDKTSADYDIIIPDISDLATKEELNTKQNKLIAGTNITINPDTNVISSSGSSGGDSEGIFAFEIIDGDLYLVYSDSGVQPNIYIEENDLIWEVE